MKYFETIVDEICQAFKQSDKVFAEAERAFKLMEECMTEYKAKPLVIGLAGRANSGKDTTAVFMKERFEEAGLKVDIVHLADPLKRLGEIFFTREQMHDQILKAKTDDFWDITPRKFLQLVGTDFFRRQWRDDVWAKLMEKYIYENRNNADVIIIADVRFPNEAEMCKRLEATHRVELITIYRKEVEEAYEAQMERFKFIHFLQKLPLNGFGLLYILKKLGTNTTGVHASERHIEYLKCNREIRNNEHLMDLRYEARKIARSLIRDGLVD